MGISTFLNGGTVSQLRGAAFLALSDVAHVGAGTVTDDSGGGATFGWTYGSAVPCRIDPLTADERVIASRISERSSHLVTLPPWTPVEPENRVSIDGRGTYEVTAIQQRTGEPLRFVEVVEVT